MSRRSLGRLAALTLAVLIGALGLAACGSSSGGGSDEDQVRTVVNHLADSDKAVCDELTDGYLKKIFKDKDRCEKQADNSKENDAFEIKSVKVNGDKATAAVTTKKKESGTIALVKEGGDWKIDNIQESGPSASDTNTDTGPNSDEVKARAAVDAFLKAVNDEDEQVVCGLLSEGYAKRILHRPGAKFAIAECVTAFKNFNWANLKKQAEGVKSKNVAVFGGAASVTLSDGETVNLKRQDDRFVIDNIHR
jgi:hypothetical protein